jgi:uncharacterized protein
MKHRKFCERFVAALAAGDFDTMGTMLHPDFVVVEADGLPYAGIYRGLDGWRALSRAVVETWAGFSIRPIAFLGETSNTFVVRFAISGRSRKTGNAFETTVLELWQFRDGLLAAIDPYYWDTHLLALVNGG